MNADRANQPRQLAGLSVFPLALGCMGMSEFYGPADHIESIATIHAALDAGITLLDTGDFYGMGHNELLLRDALRRGVPRDSVFIQVKFGGQRDPSGAFIGHDASPAAAKNSLAYTLTRLGTDYVDLYQPARLDPQVPIEETVGAIAEMVRAGYVRHIGLSEVGAETIRLAQDDPRTRFPRFSGENHARNLELLAALEAIAERVGGGVPAGGSVTAAQ